MQTAPIQTIFGVITDFLATNPSPEEIIAYELPEILQARAIELLEKNDEGELAPDEHDEMMDFVRIDNMLLLLKAKLTLRLTSTADKN